MKPQKQKRRVLGMTETIRLLLRDKKVADAYLDAMAVQMLRLHPDVAVELLKQHGKVTVRNAKNK